jgi:hypothetical protein
MTLGRRAPIPSQRGHGVIASNAVSESGLTRRELLRAGAAAGALAGVGSLAAPARVLERALAAPSACGSLSEIEHVVIFIN